MNNEFKNLGVAFGLASTIEGLSLTKIQIPSMQGAIQSIYQIKSNDGSIDYTIDLNDEDFALESSEILRDLLEWTYTSITGRYTNYPACDEKEETNNILEIINLLKDDARECIAEIDINRGTEVVSAGEYKLRRIESGVYEFQDSIYGTTEHGADDFKICEYALTFLCEIYGDTCLDKNKIFKDCTLEDWEKAIEDTEIFMDQVTDVLDEIDLLNIIGETMNNDGVFDGIVSHIMNELIEHEREEDMDMPENNEDKMQDTLDYLRYKQAKEDYEQNHDLPHTESIENKGTSDQDYTHEEDILKKYAEDKYIDKIAEMMGLEDSEFLRKLANKAQSLFGKDEIPDGKKLQNLADLLNDTREPLDDRHPDDDGMDTN